MRHISLLSFFIDLNCLFPRICFIMAVDEHDRKHSKSGLFDSFEEYLVESLKMVAIAFNYLLF